MAIIWKGKIVEIQILNILLFWFYIDNFNFKILLIYCCTIHNNRDQNTRDQNKRDQNNNVKNWSKQLSLYNQNNFV